MIFAVSGTNPVGATVEDLQQGDKVRVFYAESDTDSGPIVNAVQIDKVSTTGDAAMTGQNAQWQVDQVDEVDQNAGTVRIDGQDFTVDPAAAVGVDLGELQPGNEVRIVYDEAGTSGKQVVEITKVD